MALRERNIVFNQAGDSLFEVVAQGRHISVVDVTFTREPVVRPLMTVEARAEGGRPVFFGALRKGSRVKLDEEYSRLYIKFDTPDVLQVNIKMFLGEGSYETDELLLGDAQVDVVNSAASPVRTDGGAPKLDFVRAVNQYADDNLVKAFSASFVTELNAFSVGANKVGHFVGTLWNRQFDAEQASEISPYRIIKVDTVKISIFESVYSQAIVSMTPFFASLYINTTVVSGNVLGAETNGLVTTNKADLAVGADASDGVGMDGLAGTPRGINEPDLPRINFKRAPNAAVNLPAGTTVRDVFFKCDVQASEANSLIIGARGNSGVSHNWAYIADAKTSAETRIAVNRFNFDVKHLPIYLGRGDALAFSAKFKEETGGTTRYGVRISIGGYAAVDENARL